MATTNIELDIENITGVSDANAQFLISAQKSVAARIPKDLLKWTSTFTVPGNHGGNTSDGVKITMPIATDSILDVSRNGFSADEVPYSMKGFIANSSSLYLATNTYPKYYLDDTNTNEGVRIIVKPIPTDSETAVALYVDYTKIDDDCDLRNAVVYHAAASEFTKLASGKVTDWSDLIPPISPIISDSTVTFSTNVPTYTKPVMSLSTLTSISDLSISAALPVTPSISAGSVTITGTAPTYTAPVLSLTTFPTITWTFPSIPVAPSTSAQTVATFGNVPTFTPPVMSSLDFADTEDLITNEEDSEMLSSRVQEINAKIQEFSARLGETQSKFNKENSIFQADIQEKITEAQLSDGEENRKLQKYQNEISSYQAEVNKIITGNQSEIAEWQQQNNVEIQKYGTDIQNNLNTFNKENIQYQAILQKDIQDAQLTDSNEAKKIQKYSSEIQSYQGEVNTEVQKFTSNFQKNIQVFQQENEIKLSEYQTNIQNELNVFNKENAEYQAQLQISIQNAQLSSQDDAQKLQDYSSKVQAYASEVNEMASKINSSTQNATYYSAESKKYYEWANAEISSYIQNNSKMINKTMAAQAAQQQRK